MLSGSMATTLVLFQILEYVGWLDSSPASCSLLSFSLASWKLGGRANPVQLGVGGLDWSEVGCPLSFPGFPCSCWSIWGWTASGTDGAVMLGVVYLGPQVATL